MVQVDKAVPVQRSATTQKGYIKHSAAPGERRP